MICAKCQAAVPEESTFCLRCGTRLVALERLAPVNGGKGGRPGGATVAASVRPAGVEPARPAAAGGKEAYALSFKPLTDAGLCYRVARWLSEVAPAHPATEVQARLTAGGFATFLALTPAEAEAARQRIQALGAHPAFWQLKPATIAEMLLPERPRPAGQKAWTTQHKVAVAISLLVFVVCAVFSCVQYTHIAAKGTPNPRQVPGIGVPR